MKKIEEHRHSVMPLPISENIDCRKTWMRKLTAVYVIISDYGNFLRHLDGVFIQAFKHSGSHDIVESENSVTAESAVEQIFHIAIGILPCREAFAYCQG